MLTSSQPHYLSFLPHPNPTFYRTYLDSIHDTYPIIHLAYRDSILYYINRDEGSSGLPFTVLSANSTAESVFGSICGQQLISSREELGTHSLLPIISGNF